jgi:hypothetical protein
MLAHSAVAAAGVIAFVMMQSLANLDDESLILDKRAL